MSVVVAYSPSEQGRHALRAAVRESRARDLPLVVASHSYIDSEGTRTGAGEDAVRRELGGLEGADAPSTLRIRCSADEGVDEFLLGVAEAEAADLLVIGLRAKSRTGKLNLGTAARRVVLGAPCPVLAVKGSAGA
ncbi:universal stress protein [Brachybacterium huguangmaarense]|uniref:Universal stress protein n=1 Tax=Brachybacterium huguangmaarense TaxID=1652028 RepID=A0ABY6FZW6_9MICO|nr:universal stress protein [Brachybacterium huguangmaarense]UYG16492.1 universal stress protein [Brachybacterium huguangmaarense]